MNIPCMSPSVCFVVEKIIDVSGDGDGNTKNYCVQWAPTWVNGSNLIGCQNLIEEFLRKQNVQDNEDGNMVDEACKSVTIGMDSQNYEQGDEMITESCETVTPLENTLDEEENIAVAKTEEDYYYDYSNERGEVYNSPTDEALVEQDDSQTVDGMENAGIDGTKLKNKDDAFVTPLENFSFSTNETYFDTSNKAMEDGVHVRQIYESLDQSSDIVSRTRSNTVAKSFNPNYRHKSFATDDHLQRHSLSYNRAKPHQCTQCGKQFSQSGHLQTHMVTHSGEKPHKCTQCHKTFARKFSLTRHSKLHSGERPHVCQHCGKSFIERKKLTLHMERTSHQ